MTSVSDDVAKRCPLRFQLAPQLPVVVDLAVEDDANGAVLVVDRLMTACEVDDREPPHAETRPDRGSRRPSSSGPRCTITSHIARSCSMRGRRTVANGRRFRRCRTSGKNLQQAAHLRFVRRPRVRALVKRLGTAQHAGAALRPSIALENAIRHRRRLGLDQDAYIVGQHLRVRPDTRGDQRFAAGKLLVDLQRRVSALDTRRNQHVGAGRSALARTRLAHLAREDTGPAQIEAQRRPASSPRPALGARQPSATSHRGRSSSTSRKCREQKIETLVVLERTRIDDHGPARSKRPRLDQPPHRSDEDLSIGRRPPLRHHRRSSSRSTDAAPARFRC